MIAELGATDWGVVARAIHVLAVVVWIGSVWLVTMVLLPGMKNKAPADWVREFDAASTCSTSTTCGTGPPRSGIGGWI
jgi:hypothetical protein